MHKDKTMGYQKNKRKKINSFVMIDTEMLHSEEWKKLTHSEMITYIYIRSNYNGRNNGSVPLKYTELKGVLAPGTLSNALKGLINKKWVKKTKHGGMFRFSCLYKLTGRYDPLVNG